MDSCIFNLHNVTDLLKDNENIVIFVVNPNDKEVEEDCIHAADVATVLNAHWAEAPSRLTIEELMDPEQADLLLSDAFDILDEHMPGASSMFGIADLVCIGSHVVAFGFMCDSDAADVEVDDEEDPDNWG